MRIDYICLSGVFLRIAAQVRFARLQAVRSYLTTPSMTLRATTGHSLKAVPLF